MKFEEFIRQPGRQTSPEPGMIIDGSFQCQSCGEQVDEAEYFQSARILRWNCSEGHTSFIEEFRL